MSRRMGDPAARFWAKVDKNGPVHPTLGTRCWIWTANRRNGYGSLRMHDGARWIGERAHRAVWTIIGEPLAAGEFSLHRCDVKACVNPAHLFRGTQADNLADAGAKGLMSRDVSRERNPRAILTTETVAAIRAVKPPRYAKNRHLVEALAAEYGIAENYVRALWSGSPNWKEG